MEPTALTTDMSMMLATLVDSPRCLATQLDMESTMAITSSATTFFLMGAVLSLVAVLLLAPMSFIVGLNTMATYLITSGLCMASLLPTCLVLAMGLPLVLLLLALLPLRPSMWEMVLLDVALYMVDVNLSAQSFSMGAAL